MADILATITKATTTTADYSAGKSSAQAGNTAGAEGAQGEMKAKSGSEKKESFSDELAKQVDNGSKEVCQDESGTDTAVENETPDQEVTATENSVDSKVESNETVENDSSDIIDSTEKNNDNNEMFVAASVFVSSEETIKYAFENLSKLDKAEFVKAIETIKSSAEQLQNIALESNDLVALMNKANQPQGEAVTIDNTIATQEALVPEEAKLAEMGTPTKESETGAGLNEKTQQPVSKEDVKESVVANESIDKPKSLPRDTVVVNEEQKQVNTVEIKSEQTEASATLQESMAKLAEKVNASISSGHTEKPVDVLDKITIDGSNTESLDKLGVATVQSTSTETSQNTVSEVSTRPVVTNEKLEVASQVIDNIRTNISVDKQNVSVFLDPPELGRVSIKISQHAGEVTGVLEVERSDVKNDIQRELPAVISALNDAGIQVKKVEVVLTDSENADFMASAHDFGSGQASTQQGEEDFGSAAKSSLDGDVAADVLVNEVSDDSINVYM